LKISFINRATVSSCRVYYQAFDVRQTSERQPAQINSAVETMERRVDVGSGVGDHFDAPDLKGRSLGVPVARRLAAQVVGYDRGGKTWIGDHSRFNLMAYVN
jgi:hypothetical protein